MNEKLGFVVFGKREGFYIFKSFGCAKYLVENYDKKILSAIQLELENIKVQKGTKIYSFSRFYIDSTHYSFFLVYEYAVDNFGRDGYVSFAIVLKNSKLKSKEIIKILSSAEKELSNLLISDFKISERAENTIDLAKFLQKNYDIESFNKKNSYQNKQVFIDLVNINIELELFFDLNFNDKYFDYSRFYCSDSSIIKEYLSNIAVSNLPSDNKTNTDFDLENYVLKSDYESLLQEYQKQIDKNNQLQINSININSYVLKSDYEKLKIEIENLSEKNRQMKIELDELKKVDSNLKAKNKDAETKKGDNAKANDKTNVTPKLSFAKKIYKKKSVKIIAGFLFLILFIYLTNVIITNVTTDNKDKINNKDSNVTIVVNQNKDLQILIDEIEQYLKKDEFMESITNNYLSRLNTYKQSTTNMNSISNIQKYEENLKEQKNKFGKKSEIINEINKYIEIGKTHE